jgi:hypothetical protein
MADQVQTGGKPVGLVRGKVFEPSISDTEEAMILEEIIEEAVKAAEDDEPAREPTSTTTEDLILTQLKAFVDSDAQNVDPGAAEVTDQNCADGGDVANRHDTADGCDAA